MLKFLCITKRLKMLKILSGKTEVGIAGTCNSTERRAFTAGCLRYDPSCVSSRATSGDASAGGIYQRKHLNKASPEASDWPISIQHVATQNLMICVLPPVPPLRIPPALRHRLRWHGRPRMRGRAEATVSNICRCITD